MMEKAEHGTIQSGREEDLQFSRNEKQQAIYNVALEKGKKAYPQISANTKGQQDEIVGRWIFY
jgi:hypothetical protein